MGTVTLFFPSRLAPFILVTNFIFALANKKNKNRKPLLCCHPANKTFMDHLYDGTTTDGNTLVKTEYVRILENLQKRLNS